MKKKPDIITELGVNMFFEAAKLSVAARRLEKEHHTKIVAMEICFIATNGEIVYTLSTSKRAAKLVAKWIKTYSSMGLEVSEEARKLLAEAIPFGCFARLKKPAVNE